MKLLIASALAFLLAGASTGCSGNGGEQAEDDSGTARAEVEATLDQLALPTPDREAFCEVFSPRQLKESFGKRDPVNRCMENLERRGEIGLRTYEVLEIEQECARAEVVDQRGREALFFLHEIDGRWLIDNIEDTATPTATSDAVCGEVRLFGEGR